MISIIYWYRSDVVCDLSTREKIYKNIHYFYVSKTCLKTLVKCVCVLQTYFNYQGRYLPTMEWYIIYHCELSFSHGRSNKYNFTVSEFFCFYSVAYLKAFNLGCQEKIQETCHIAVHRKSLPSFPKSLPAFPKVYPLSRKVYSLSRKVYPVSRKVYPISRSDDYV